MFKSLALIISCCLLFAACGGGGGGGSGNNPPNSYSPTALTVSPTLLKQVGFNKELIPSGESIIDLKPAGAIKYLYLNIENNQEIPIYDIDIFVYPDQAKLNQIPNPTDSQDCSNFNDQGHLLEPGASCRILFSAVLQFNTDIYENDQAMIATRQLAVKFAYKYVSPDCSLCVYNGIIESVVPTEFGRRLYVSESNIVLRDFVLDNTLLYASPDATYLYTEQISSLTSPLDRSQPAKYRVTYTSDGRPWVDLNPTEVFYRSHSQLEITRGYRFLGILLDGTPSCDNCDPLLKATDALHNVYSYDESKWQIIPHWLDQRGVMISNLTKIYNGGDGNAYLNSQNGEFNPYRINKNFQFQQLNLPSNHWKIEAVASDGTIIFYDGCAYSDDGVNYSIVPFNTISESVLIPSEYQGAVFISGHRIDTRNHGCRVNPIYSFSIIDSDIVNHGSVLTSRGAFILWTIGDRMAAYPFPPQVESLP